MANAYEKRHNITNYQVNAIQNYLTPDRMAIIKQKQRQKQKINKNISRK